MATSDTADNSTRHRWQTAPGPGDGIFRIEFDPCPADLGHLPGPVERATAAAMELNQAVSNWEYVAGEALREEGDPGFRLGVLNVVWWRLVAMIQPARGYVKPIAGYFNRGRGDVVYRGQSARSAHQLILDLAEQHTSTLLHQLGLPLIDPSEVCRQTPAGLGNEPAAHPNQRIQDFLHSHVEQIQLRYPDECRSNAEVLRLDHLLMDEARAAAPVYREDHPAGDRYRTVVKPEWAGRDSSVFIDGHPMTVSMNEYKLLKRLAEGRGGVVRQGDLDDIVPNAVRTLRRLRETGPPWSEVIKMAEQKSREGYRLE